jgi:hypothetical protein
MIRMKLNKRTTPSQTSGYLGLIVEVIRREKLPALALPKIKMIFEPAGTIHVGRLGYGFTEVLPLVCHSTTLDRGAILLEDRQPVIDS